MCCFMVDTDYYTYGCYWLPYPWLLLVTIPMVTTSYHTHGCYWLPYPWLLLVTIPMYIASTSEKRETFSLWASSVRRSRSLDQIPNKTSHFSGTSSR